MILRDAIAESWGTGNMQPEKKTHIVDRQQFIPHLSRETCSVIVLVSAGLPVIIAALVLLGWTFDIVALTNIHPKMVAMNPMTAICLIACGTALSLLWGSARSSPRRRVGSAIAICAGLVGAAKLASYLCGQDLPLDQILFARKLNASTPVNRMAPNTALCFLLLGAALAASVSRRAGLRLMSQLVTIAAAFVAILGTIGHLGGILSLYSITDYIGMALHTAIGIVILTPGVMVLAGRPQLTDFALKGTATADMYRADRSLQRRIAVGFVVAIFVIGLIGVASYASLMQLLHTMDQSDRTRQGQLVNVDLESAVKEMFMGVRGYVISGDSSYLEPYEEAVAEVKIHLDELRRLAADDPRRTADIDHVAGLIGDCRNIVEQYIELRKDRGFEAAQSAILSGNGSRRLIGIDKTLAAMNYDDSLKLQGRIEEEAASIHKTVLILALGSVTALILVGFSGVQIHRGIKARADAEALRRESESRYRFLADALPQILWTTKPDGGVDYLNPRWSEYTGQSMEASAGWNWKDLNIVHPDDLERCVDQWTASVQSGHLFEGEYRFRRAIDGAYRWFLCRGLPRRDDEGRIIQWVGTFTDVDDNKRAAEELERARALSESASRAKSQFLAHMSHEIRTPLNGIIGTIDLLSGTNLDPQQQRFCRLARTSAESLTALISDVLDLSKIEAGKLELESVPFKLNLAVEEVIQLLAQRASQKGLELACYIDPAVPVDVCGDPDRLRQVLVNLVNNAIKFTERGHVAVRITADEVAPQSTIVRFSVTDSGIGIPPERLDRLFKSFSQVDPSTTRTYGGTGLGLAISRQIVTLMAGQIGVDSKLGQGSTFWFTAQLAREMERVGREPVICDGRLLKVLAVDDHPIGREILIQQLISWGFEATARSDGPAALKLLTEAAEGRAPFHVAIIDDDLPDMPAELLAAQIRARNDLRGTVLMILLSMQAGVDSKRLKELGFAGHIAKPVRQSQLFDAIQNALAVAHEQSGIASAASRPREVKADIGSRSERRAKVLIAEDNEVNLTVAAEILKRFGHSYNSVRNGAEAVEAAMAERYDVILMDCLMPVLDGLQASRRIREAEAQGEMRHSPGRHVPIIALTANAIKGDRETCLASGMDDYISKPLNPKTLIEKIEAILDNQPPPTVVPSDPQSASQRPSDDRGEGESGVPSPLLPPIDMDALLAQWGRDRSFVEALVAQFLSEAPRDVNRVVESIQNRNLEDLRFVAHSLKGSASYVQAHEVRRAAVLLESMAKAGDLTDAKACAAKLAEAVRKCLALRKEKADPAVYAEVR